MTALLNAINAIFPAKTVVVIGDIVADQFINGTISCVSREAPVFIMRHDETTTLPGAAANAAANVAALGAKAVMIGITGVDTNASKLSSALETCSVDISRIVSTPEFSTTTKVRVLAGQQYAGRQQVIRIDYENQTPVADETKGRLRQSLADVGPAADAMIVSDYGYGSVFTEIYQDALAISQVRSIPLVVDSRYRLADLAGATTATPNREEIEQILGKDFTADDCAAVRKQLGLEALLVTNGNKGMTLFEKDKPAFDIDVVGSAEPVDVTGAGDTVIATYALGLASGLSFREAATAANHAGGIVVMKKRTATASADELLASIAANSDPLATKHAG